MTNRRLYFCHGYAPEDRPLNEHLWRLFLKAGFYSWIDTGLDGGWSGRRLPMEISFNEWMMSRCDGFAAIVPQRKSPYQRLEYRLAERMGLPRFVVLQQGGTFAAPATEIIEVPVSWNLFWRHEKQTDLEAAIKNFVKRVDEQTNANRVLGSVGRWRPRAISDELRVALLRPRAEDIDWIRLQGFLEGESGVRWQAVSPGNLRSEAELVAAAFDLLVVDIGPAGTPRELVGYLHALGMPQIRVCRVKNDDEAKEWGRHLAIGQSGQKRRPYERDLNGSDRESLPRFLDGLKLDAEMEPVIFWRTPEDLTARLRSAVSRIEAFRSHLSPEEGGRAVEVSTHEGARQYFAQRYQHTERAYVFISFAGRGDAADVPDRLAPILRFLNCRCFHYRDVDSHADARLETGEYVQKGLALRLEQADVAVLLIDHEFLASEYCLSELRLAMKLHNEGLLSLRAYAVDPAPKMPDELKNISVHVFRGLKWLDAEIEQRVIEDVQQSVSASRRPLRDDEQKQLIDWLDDDGGSDASRVWFLLQQSGVPEAELAAVDLNLTGTKGLLLLRDDRTTHRRNRELIALLVLAAAAGRPERLKHATRWLSARRLVGWPAPPVLPAEDVIDLDVNPTPIGTIEVEQAVEIGQQLAVKNPAIMAQRGPVCLVASNEALALPVEWARESAAAEPIALRRPIRWRLPGVGTRSCVHELVSAREVPPTVLALGLAAEDVEPTTETRQVAALLRERYSEMSWPAEFVRTAECEGGKDFISRLDGCRDQIVHIAGHLGPDGFQVGKDLVQAEDVAAALEKSDIRLLVLNGCDGATVKSPLAVEYLTLADRLVRDGRVAEVVAHRAKIAVSDALLFAQAFYNAFFGKTAGFEPAQAVLQARKAGSARLRLCPVVISQRMPAPHVAAGGETK